MNTVSPPPAEKSPSPPRFDPGYINAMSHFYRGELGRIMVWRSRLDVTTTWAITTTTSIVTVAFTFPQLPHIIVLFNLAIVWMMLWIEARRYRFYDAYHARVRMLEAHFLVPMVMQNAAIIQGDWRKLVSEDLILPRFKISMAAAIGRRMRRNYLFVFLIILCAWIVKVILHAPADIHITSLRTFLNALALPGFSWWPVAGIFIATYTAVIGFMLYVTRKATSEITEFGPHRQQWRI